MYLKEIKEQIIYYSLYKPNEKIKCISRTYYGHHRKDSDYHYVYKNEIIPVKE